MVTYSDLFEFCILMVTVIGLVIKVCTVEFPTSSKNAWGDARTAFPSTA